MLCKMLYNYSNRSTQDNYKLSEVETVNKLKIIVSICLLVLCITSAIINGISCEGRLKLVGILISSIVAFADMFLALIPCIFTQLSIKSSQIDPNRYNYKKRNFVDRKFVFSDITRQISSLATTTENIMWIRLYGEDGIGKKTFVSKIFQKYKYPFNRFYFIDDVEGLDIIELICEKYPINNISYVNSEIYLHNLSKARRTFVVLEAKSNDLSERATRLLTKWCERIGLKHKLILIVLDKTSEKAVIGNQAIVFEYKLDRLIEEDSKMLTERLLKHKCSKANDIIQAADGLPAAIKTLCNYYLKGKEHFESSDWIEVFFRLKNNSKKTFLDFCILSIVRGSFTLSVAYSIVDNQTISFFVDSNLLVKTSYDVLYVPMWIVKTILISEKYNKQIKCEIDYLNQKSILIENENKQMIALIEKNPIEILDVLRCFVNDGALIQIKEFYSKLNVIFDIEDNQHKQIIIIIMESLLKLGEYGLFNNSFTKLVVHISRNMSNIDFRFNLLIADYFHLTSQYDKSNAIYFMLNNTVQGRLNELELKFNLAHNFRHMGKLSTAKRLFYEIERTADHNNKFYIRAVTSRISIEYFMDNSFKADIALSELFSLAEQPEVRFNVYRHIANIYRRTEDGLDKATSLLIESINELNKLPLRIVYDYYFELAECYRQMCRKNISHYNDAILNYNYALIFAESNHDINLKLCAQFGKALVCYQKDKNKKRLKTVINNLLNDAKISDVIYYAMCTILDVLDCDNSTLPKLTELGFNHYICVLNSQEVNSLYITVM